MQAADLDVLVVDDHQAMRELLALMLAKVGVHRVRAAEDAPRALDLLRERVAHLVLADNQMPGMTGVELVAAIRDEPAFGTPRIVIISGDAGGALTKQAKAAGADAVLLKPVRPAELLSAINMLFAV
ncbi:MAG: response regulator [Hyphomonadaceae bacterium]